MTLTDAQAAALYYNRKRRRGRADDIRFAAFNSSHPIVLTRASEAWALGKRSNYAADNDRTLYAYGNDEKRIAYGELTLTGAATRLHGEAPANRYNNDAQLTDLGAQGLFNPVLVASQGQAWHRVNTLLLSVVNGETYYWRVRYRLGTSGQVLLQSFDGAVDLPIINPVAGSVNNGLSVLSKIEYLDGSVELTGTLLATTTASNARIGMGPNSMVSGENIEVWGLQVTDAYSEWIMGGDGTKAQAADAAVLQVPDGTWNVLFTFFDGTQDSELSQVVTGGTGWPIPTNYGKPITQISAVLP